MAANTTNTSPLGTHYHGRLRPGPAIELLEQLAVAALCQHSPWRKHQPQTAGQIRTGLVNILRHVAIRSWWNAKYKKFMPPDWNKNWNSRCEQSNSM
ncbi:MULTISPECIES: hypothetical protein [Nitrosomonas]|uniref:Uncharacterized protein n=1 Tax=Nitrosomonas communis TaxID=44574 RepID=A0A0F7KIS5_9PROT|nr:MULTISPECIES: hypothetical protein [Nitrosomonas]AKH38978.1 hypothetical protein AAW31_16100 [Nitrosomonas communis]UVS61139.1 hypothetical protein NX761_16890 [Nitrosomonas sp. PLL12]